MDDLAIPTEQAKQDIGGLDTEARNSLFPLALAHGRLGDVVWGLETVARTPEVSRRPRRLRTVTGPRLVVHLL
jgi:hypothetical protein